MARPDYLNKVDQCKRELSVAIVRYVQRVMMLDDYEYKDYKSCPQQRNFVADVFRAHVNNVEEIVATVIEQYNEELFRYLCCRISGSTDLDEEGEEPFPALPLDPTLQRAWFRRALAKWNAPLR